MEIKAKPSLKCPKCREVLEDYDLDCGFGRCKFCGGVDLQATTAPGVKGGATRGKAEQVA